MIHFEKFVLDNGLRVLVHPDNSTPMAVVNVMYDVGARDENPEQTGFAHLFEHLMFGGSINISEYDEPLQMAGGENNAYTTNDLTNYYIQLPVENLETALWLESDRMLSLAFSPESLEVQRKVVCEEFKEHYINKPYGDIWQHLRKLIYTTHPYQWQTIGKELKHVEDAKLEDVKAFFNKHYNPTNAIMVIAGPVTTEQVKPLVEKWFGSIPAGNKYHRQLPVEPAQKEARTLKIEAKVPATAFFKVWHTGGRLDANYHATDLISEILGGGASSRLYQRLVKEQRLFSSISCSHFGSIDPDILVIEGKLVDGANIAIAENAVQQEVDKLLAAGVTENELQKVINKTESLLAFEDMSLMNRANNLAFYELLGDANGMNTEFSKYEAVDLATLHEVAMQIFTPENSNTMHYLSVAEN